MPASRVRDAMWPVNEVAREDRSLADAIEMMKGAALATVPVLRTDGRLDGTLFLRDAIAADGPDETVASLARRDATVDADSALEAAIDLLQSHRVNRLPVTKAADVVGMVSQGDLLAAAMLDELEAPIGQVSRAVADGDKMYLNAAGAYLYVGVLAVKLIKECLAAAGAGRVRRILDFGCGHGRVMRVLRPVFADAELVACDLNHDAVSFCAEHFGAVPVYSSKDPAAVAIEGSFDLIWSGSVLTHLDPSSWKPVLSMLAQRLDPGGVAVMSTNGEPMTQVWEAGRWDYSLPPGELAELIASYREYGAGYRPYPDRHEYGLSVCSVERMAEIASAAGLQVVLRMEGAWAPRRGTVGQDVVALTRK